MLQELGHQTNVHAAVWVGKSRRGPHPELDIELRLLGSVTRELDQRRIHVEPVDVMSRLGPETALRAGSAADVQDLETLDRDPVAGCKREQLVLDRAKPNERRVGEALLLVIAVKARVRVMVEARGRPRSVGP